jgi:nicotinamide-nucleotide amidase
MNLEAEVGKLLRHQHISLGTVESATGGLIAHRITDISGSSEYFKGSVTAYSNEVKIRIVGVNKETIERHGAVSPEVALEMAESGRKLLGTDICIADTGIAGPTGGSPAKPVGLFYLGLSHAGGMLCRKFVFYGDRWQNKKSAAEAALKWLMEFLSSTE